MKCKRCKAVIDKHDRFCRYCGEKLFVDSTEVKVPKPKQLADGSYYAQVYADGVRRTIKGKTLDEYKANARAFKAEEHEPDEPETGKTITEMVSDYIEKNKGILADSTIRNYNNFQRIRFPDAMDCYPEAIDWQALINRELKTASVGTVKNAWNLVHGALTEADHYLPHVKFPKSTIPNEKHFLEYDEILVLLDFVKGNKYELPILLALHSLRVEEIAALEAEDIRGGFIRVHRVRTLDISGAYRVYDRTKTEKSRREIQIFIPRLLEIIPETGRMLPCSQNYFAQRVKTLCKKAGVTVCTAHDLRRSFASLAYHFGLKERAIMRYGGWSSAAVMHEIYIHLYSKDLEEAADILRQHFTKEITNDT